VTDTDAARSRVRELLSQWQAETAHLSHSKTDHPAARAIVAMGQAAVPALFAALAENDLQAPQLVSPPGAYLWAFALIGEILGDGPVIPEEQCGRLRYIVGAYVSWGRERGYLP